MVSASWTLTGRESALGILARWFRRRGAQVGAVLSVALRLLLVVAGFSLGTASLWVAFGLAAGLAGAAVSCLLLEWVVKRR